MTYENMTEEDVARMTPIELWRFESDLRRELLHIDYEQAANAKKLAAVEKDLREYRAQQAYWARKYRVAARQKEKW